jgi:hypothetical protein
VVLVQNLQVQLIGPPITIRPAAAVHYRALHFVAHVDLTSVVVVENLIVRQKGSDG